MFNRDADVSENEEELKEVIDIFNAFGKSEVLSEKDFHGFIALCGSSPA